ncbi:MAG: ABC transporter substrate-binding protein [Spirochaetota bacterium]
MKHVAKLFLAVLVLMAFTAPVLFGGGSAEEAIEATDPTGNPWTDGEDLSGTEVNIFGAFVDTDAERFRTAMEPFMEETGIRVVYEGSGDFEQLITVRTEGGDPPDIAAFPQPGLMRDLHSEGYILNVLDWFDMSFLEQQYNEGWIADSMVDDEVAGVWYRASVKSLVWYPPAVFEEEGYEIPETWDELLDLSDQMVEDGYSPWSISMESAGATGWVATDWIEDIMLRIHPPEVYDEWVAGELQFDSPEFREALDIMLEIWLNEDYVLGGTDSILTVPFGDGPAPLVADPPQALMHRQASFITGFMPDGTDIGPDGDVNFFYLPPIDPDMGSPVLTAGDIMSPMEDRPEVRAVMRYLAHGESTRGWLEQGGFVSPHEDANLDWYPELDQGYAEILTNADIVRFDASDLMPGSVGAGSFWTGMVDIVSGEDIDSTLPEIDEAYPD